MNTFVRRGAAWPLFLVLVLGCGGGDSGSEAAPTAADNPLMAPNALAAEAPESFRARFETSKGTIVFEVERALSPNGADRFYTLVSNGYYDGVRFYRVIDGFMVQFGMHGDPYVNAAWRQVPIPDDPVVGTNERGALTFAMTGQPNSRTTQVFVNFVDNGHLDESGFAPIGRVVEGMDVVDQLYSGYGEGPPRGTGPYQGSIAAEGNEYLNREFPELDYITSATIE